MSSWSRLFCCVWPGADAPETATNEPIYESIDHLHQAHDAEGTLRLVVQSVDELRRMLVPIADVPERMRRLEQHLHPLLVYRPEDGHYMDMMNGPRPAPAAPPAVPYRSVYLQWLQERTDYGEPW